MFASTVEKTVVLTTQQEQAVWQIFSIFGASIQPQFLLLKEDDSSLPSARTRLN